MSQPLKCGYYMELTTKQAGEILQDLATRDPGHPSHEFTRQLATAMQALDESGNILEVSLTLALVAEEEYDS